MSKLLSNTIATTAIPDTPLNAVQSANTGVSQDSVVDTQGESTSEEQEQVIQDLIPSKADTAAVTPNDDGIININIEPIKKKRFCINGDIDHMLELNISDVNIISRLEKSLKKLTTLQQDAITSSKEMSSVDLDDEESFVKLSENLDRIDKDMRELVDYIFNAPVSECCARDGSMYDMFKGAFRYEHIIETLMKLYESNIKVEYSEMRNKVSKYTSKYTKKRK